MTLFVGLLTRVKSRFSISGQGAIPQRFQARVSLTGILFIPSNRVDPAANAVVTINNHGRMSYPAALKSPGIWTSSVHERDKALRFPTGQVNQRHTKSVPWLHYADATMRAPSNRSIAPVHHYPIHL